MSRTYLTDKAKTCWWTSHLYQNFGIPCKCITFWKKRCATKKASLVFLQVIKYVIFDNLSTTTSIESQPILVQGNLNIKFMDKSNQIFSETCNVCLISCSAIVPCLLDKFGTSAQSCEHLYSIATNNITFQQALYAAHG